MLFSFANSKATHMCTTLVLICIASRIDRSLAIFPKGTPACPPERPSLVTNALETNSPVYYFGLGSNMSREKLENRSICGSKINPKRMEAAVVPNYRLAFNFGAFPPLEPGMGSIEPLLVENPSKALSPYRANECHGALVLLSAEDYEKVARSEGINGNVNQGYEEIVVTAIPYNRRHKPVQAVALRAREHLRMKKDPCPSLRYMQILRKGAQELGLKPCYQEFLNNHPVQTSSNVLKKIAVLNLVWTGTASFRLKLRIISVVQKRLLFKVYAPSTANKFATTTSEIATALILLPGAILGIFVLLGLRITGRMSPMVKAMVDAHW